MDEQFYITGLKNDDERIFRELFELYHSRLCYYATSILSGDESSEDVVQEAFVRLWQKRAQFSDLPAVRAFLYVTVRNQCLDIYKHDKVIRKYGDLLQKEDHTDQSINYLIEAEVLEKVHGAIQKLPLGCRNIMKLSYFEGLKNQDIADQLHVSINTVKTQKKRGLHLLRVLLKASSFLW